MNIILVIADTLRRDYLPFHGDKTTLAPNLASFAGRSAILEDAHPASFPTVPTRADILTGRHTFTYMYWGPLGAHEITLAQCLSEAGYHTFGVADTPFLTRRGFGYDRGFQDFIQMRSQPLSGWEFSDYRRTRVMEEDYAAPSTFRTAADWIERNHRDPFFAYIDTWDPHEPWDPPAFYVRPYLPDYQGEVIQPPYWDYHAAGVSESDLTIARACYRGEISMVDRWFGFMIERLRTLGVLEDTVILFTSDHGFYFGEHGQFGKRRFRWKDNLAHDEGYRRGRTIADGLTFRSPLHNEITRVPLLVAGPGIAPGRFSGLVSLPDLMPTILELAGTEVPETVQAHSFLPLLRGHGEGRTIAVTAAPFEQPGDVSRTVDDLGRVVVETSPATITDGEWDLLYSDESGPVELYHRSDAAHSLDVSREQPGVVKRLHGQFVEFLEQQGTSERILASRRKV